MFLEILYEKWISIVGVLLSYILIFLIIKRKINIKSPFIFAFIITIFYIIKFSIFGLDDRINGDLINAYYPMTQDLLNGINPYAVPIPESIPYAGGVLWIIILTIPLFFWNNIIVDAFFIAIIYMISVIMFYKLSVMIGNEEETSIISTQIFSLIPLTWFNVRYANDDIFILTLSNYFYKIV